MTKRIVHIIATLERSSAEKQLLLLSEGLSRQEFDVHVIALCSAGPLKEELTRRQVPLTTIKRAWPIDPSAYLRLRREIVRLQPDLVHTWAFTANTYGRQAANAAGVRKVVATERAVDLWKQWHHLAIDRRLAKRTSAIVVNSPQVADFYREHGIAADKLRMIPDGVPPAPGSPLTRQQLLGELDLPEGARLVGTMSRLWPSNRLKQMIWAIDLLHVIRDDVHLIVIGDGPQRQVLERYSRLCQVDEHVHFLGARSDVERLLPHFDVLWQASGTEGLSGAVLESMAAGVPVVVSDVCGNRALVKDGETGFLVPVGDRAALARYADKILNDPALASRLAAAGRERIQTEFTPEAMVSRHAALYRELLD